MKKYLIHNLKKDNFNVIITLLDYQTPISKVLNSIRLSSNKLEKILIDTALCSGLNEYRFIEATLNESGSINLDQYRYVNVNDFILDKANDILRQNKLYLKNSILTESQIKKLK